MKIGLTLAEARRRAGLAQKEVAQRLGISPSYLSDIEKDRRIMSEDRVPLLPVEILPPVAQAMIAGHQEAIDRLRAMHQKAIDMAIDVRAAE